VLAGRRYTAPDSVGRVQYRMTGGPYRNPPMAVALRREMKPNQFEMGISPCRPAGRHSNRIGGMAAAADGEQDKELLSSVVADIRSYSGSDPLRPWLRGVRKMERALPPATLREKLPRFLQKCAQEFQDDLRYRDDPRYLRVWIQLVTHPPTPIAATTRLGPLPRPLFTADPMHHKFMVGLLSK